MGDKPRTPFAPSVKRAAPEAAFLALLFLAAGVSSAQDNFEIQVYASDTVVPGTLMVELHSNFTAQGSTTSVNGLRPTNHAWHETIELTAGINSWFETGFYIFTSAASGSGWQWVGDHVRPRVRAPESWHWPLGVSLSTEVGYQRRPFSTSTWSLELRPIVDKKAGAFYLSLNPSLERSLSGEKRGFEFSPNVKASYDVTSKVSAGFEYYGALGPLSGFDSLPDQQHQLFATVDLDVSPLWELNFGLGLGITRSTDHLIVKAIVGRRLGRGRARP